MSGMKGTRERIRRAGLYLVYTDAVSALPIEKALPLAAEGGAEIVQIREKGSRARRRRLVEEALEVLSGFGIPVIVDDDPETALALGAQGAHLGPEDMPPREARDLLGPDMVLGLSASTPAEARAAEEAGADYVGAGTVFPSPTKKGKVLIGPEGAARIVRAVSIPVFPIGGIDPAGARRLAAAGCPRAAVCAAVLAGRDVRERAAAIRRALTGASSRIPPPPGP